MAILRRYKGKGADRKPVGNYRISVFIGRDEKTGRKLYHYETFKGTIAQAREREIEIKNEKRLGTYVKPTKLNLSDFLDKWLEDYSKTHTAPSTHRVYKQQVNNHVKPVIGNIMLTSLNPGIISKYYTNRLEYGLSGQTVTHHRTMLHKAFKTAIEWGILKTNPVDGSTSIKVVKPEMETYEIDDVKVYLQGAKQTEFYALYHTDLHTGLSRSELLGLKWKDVNLDILNPSISVKRSLHEKEGGGWYLKEPKTESRRRLVSLTTANAVVLQEHYEHCKEVLKKLNGSPDDEKLEAKIKKEMDEKFIFCHLETGEPYLPGYVTKKWGKIAKDSHLKHIRLHDARHSHATILIEQGVPMKTVQERLGHAEYSTTADLYSHVTPGMQQVAAKKFDEAFKPEYNKSGNLEEK